MVCLGYINVLLIYFDISYIIVTFYGKLTLYLGYAKYSKI